ncbi:helix-turn-helix domain-containing protein [Streptomyces griseoincarnatus]
MTTAHGEGETGILRCFGQQLRLLRTSRGLTRAELGARLSYGEDMVASVELGRRIPKPEFIERADAVLEAGGYAMADHHQASLGVDALRMAAGRGDLKEGCITHSDCGAEYTSREHRTLIQELGLRRSMGRTGSCRDDAAAESFFGLLKAEIGTTVWESHEQARDDVFHFIEVDYNRTRLRKHPVYGYVTPLETRALTAQALAPAA